MAKKKKPLPQWHLELSEACSDTTASCNESLQALGAGNVDPRGVIHQGVRFLETAADTFERGGFTAQAAHFRRNAAYFRKMYTKKTRRTW